MKDLSIIVPVYNSESTLLELTSRIFNELNGRYLYELILVNDGSQDNSYEVCRSLSSKYPFVKFVSFRKNFGQISAIVAGLREAEGKNCVVMDDDLQNPPEEIPKLVNEINKGLDFVFGVPKELKHNFFRIIGSKLTLKMADLLFGKPIDIYPSSFFVIKQELAQEITTYDGPYPYISGLIFRVTNNGVSVFVNQECRKSGKSQYCASKLLKLWLSGFTNFSILPLRLASFFGTIISFFGFAALAFLIIQKVFLGKFLEGWISIVGAIILFSGIQLLALGLLGEYVGRIFMLLNRTPQYSIKEKYNCDKFNVKV